MCVYIMFFINCRHLLADVYVCCVASYLRTVLPHALTKTALELFSACARSNNTVDVASASDDQSFMRRV